MRKGLWAFFLDCAFRMLIGWADSDPVVGTKDILCEMTSAEFPRNGGNIAVQDSKCIEKSRLALDICWCRSLHPRTLSKEGMCPSSLI